MINFTSPARNRTWGCLTVVAALSIGFLLSLFGLYVATRAVAAAWGAGS